jgi:hypothetical protein
MHSNDELLALGLTVDSPFMRRLYQFLMQGETDGDDAIPGLTIGEQRVSEAMAFLRRRGANSKGGSPNKAQKLLDYLSADGPAMAAGVNVDRLKGLVGLLGQQAGDATESGFAGRRARAAQPGALIRRGQGRITEASSSEEIAAYRERLQKQADRLHKTLEEIEKELDRTAGLGGGAPRAADQSTSKGQGLRARKKAAAKALRKKTATKKAAAKKRPARR